jgi:hypothetical protein
MVRKSGSILSHRSSIKAEDCSNLDGVYVIEQSKSQFSIYIVFTSVSYSTAAGLDPTSLRRLAPASLPPNGTSSPLGLIEIPIGEIYCIDPVVGQKRSSYYEGSDHVDVNTVSFSELKGKPILFRKNRRKSELVVNQGYVSQSLLEWSNSCRK